MATPGIGNTLQNLVTKYGADVGMIHKLELEDNCLHLVAQVGAFPDDLKEVMSKIPAGKGIAGETARSGKPVFSCNITGSDAPACVRPLAKTLGILAIISVPIISNNTVVGTLGIGYFNQKEITAEQANVLLEEGKRLSEELVVA